MVTVCCTHSLFAERRVRWHGLWETGHHLTRRMRVHQIRFPWLRLIPAKYAICNIYIDINISHQSLHRNIINQNVRICYTYVQVQPTPMCLTVTCRRCDVMSRDPARVRDHMTHEVGYGGARGPAPCPSRGDNICQACYAPRQGTLGEWGGRQHVWRHRWRHHHHLPAVWRPPPSQTQLTRLVNSPTIPFQVPSVLLAPYFPSFTRRMT